MQTRIRTFVSRFTYANIMSTLAVFLVVSGGAAYAADTVFSTDIVDGQVKSIDIGNNQVSSVDVKDDTNGGGLGAADIAAGAVSQSELATDSVAFDELAFGTLPRFTYTTQSASVTDTTTVKEVQVTCSTRSDDEVSGGGFVIAGPGGVNVPNVAIQRSYAVTANTWLVRAVATSGTPNWQITAVANCIS